MTTEARTIANNHPPSRRAETTAPFVRVTARVPLPESFDPSRGRRAVKIDAKEKGLIRFGTEPIELRFVEQLVDLSQTRAVGHAIYLTAERFLDGKATLCEVVDAVERFFDQHGLDALDPFHRDERHPGTFARPRRYEISAAINRLRTLRVRQNKPGNSS